MPAHIDYHPDEDERQTRRTHRPGREPVQADRKPDRHRHPKRQAEVYNWTRRSRILRSLLAEIENSGNNLGQSRFSRCGSKC